MSQLKRLGRKQELLFTLVIFLTLCICKIWCSSVFFSHHRQPTTTVTREERHREFWSLSVCLSPLEAFHMDGPMFLQIFDNFHSKTERPTQKRVSLYLLQSRRHCPQDYSVTHYNLECSSYLISYGSSPLFSTGRTENEISNFSAETCTH